MHRRDCLRKLDTSFECARRHRQMTMKCAYSSAELSCSIPREYGWTLHEGFTWVRASNYSNNLVVLDGSFRERLGYEISRG